ncbi:pentapeptide repeat-containing protein|uniref:Uncharacterized protein YjbI, contains pentapeptide repeats n=1 Tax=Dendrosporobacter quercicolus TaxID=146817 RepID=A0A1G9KKR8_9FIRM|nr:pentapeptide repeat-containing protein [Dendrosporobacter quercicolus]NSL49715.1 pentapeptide repeat-containing protein [Dendrosporobacter quercicolus DSM 1736]SDL49995.1 Uncharacterized protein YjbI, contains pentapeptide repeats [Dendrosporobacter quercicolus]
MRDFVAAFQEERYAPLARRLLADTLRDMENGTAAASCTVAVAGAVDQAARLQQHGLPPVAYLTMAAMYTSVYFGEPKLRLDFYSEQWLAAEPVYSEYIDAAWLFVHWQEHEDAMTEAAKGQRAWVRPAHLESMRWQSFRLLAYGLYTRLKYWLQSPAIGAALCALRRTDEFYILFGEYQDWQGAVYALLTPIDIFNRSSDDSLRFRVYEKCRYSKKKFAQLDLSGSRFRDCSFEDCSFEEVDLSDVTFVGCRFDRSLFSRVRLPGALFLDTRFSEVRFRDVLAAPLCRAYEKNDAYRHLEFAGCALAAVSLADCRFPGALLTDCLLTQIEIEGGDYTDSNFQEFAVARMKEGGEE